MMRLFDTANHSYQDFEPGPVVGIYTCGITPYDSAHLGHIFTFMTYDLLQRRLEDKGHEVRLVRNVTDVDEPIYKKAAELGLPYTVLAAQETASFQAVLATLNFKKPFAEPLASQYIEQMAMAVGQLKDTGYAYAVDQDVYFDTTKLGTFGQFSGYSKRLLLNFMRARGGDPERVGKRAPLDFLLWRGISDQADPAAWNTGLGRGRPGWHIECSVMSSELLGIPFDLHGGGDDLIFPHHECEIAQSAALGHAELAKHWLHVAPIMCAGEKMSKSLGNLVFAKDLLADHPPAVIRLAMMYYHYRTGGEWQPEYLHQASRLWARLALMAPAAPPAVADSLLQAVRTALDNDLDTHAIMHALDDFSRGDYHDSTGVRAESIGTVYRLLGLGETN